jgi:CRP-like cAMP-binding protein
MPGDAAGAIEQAGRVKRFAPGATIYAQGEMGDDMYRVISGSVRLYVSNADGRQLTYLLLGPGDCFGNSSIIDGGPRPQTAEASDDCELQVLDRKSVDDLRSLYPAVSDALLHLTARQSRVLSNFFAQSYLDHPAARVAQRLVAEIDRMGLSPKAGEHVGARLSQHELASMIGATRQTVNKVLRQFKIDKLISVDRGELILHDVPRLRAMAEDMIGIPSPGDADQYDELSQV